jgi:hypothetical protein
MNGGRAAQEENDMDARNAEGPGETFVRSTGSPRVRALPVTRKPSRTPRHRLLCTSVYNEEMAEYDT